MRIIKKLLFCSLFLFFLIACENNTTTEPTDQIENREDEQTELEQGLRNEINRLEDKLEDTLEQVELLENKVNLNNPSTSPDMMQVNNSIHQLKHLVQYLPDITRKEGYIKEVVIKDSAASLAIDYAEKIDNDGVSPNNFHIENNQEVVTEVEAAKGLKVYILKETSLHYVPLESLNATLNEYDRLFDIYIIDEKLVLLTEKYIP